MQLHIVLYIYGLVTDSYIYVSIFAAVVIFHHRWCYLNFPSLRRCENISPPGTNSRTMYKLVLSWNFRSHKLWSIVSRFSIFLLKNWLIFVRTLKWYSKLTKKGKLIACRILFSFKVCSTCFNLTTWKTRNCYGLVIVFLRTLIDICLFV